MSTQVFIPVFRSLPLAIYITVKHTCKGPQSGERQLFFWLPVYKHNIIKQIDANMCLLDADVNVIVAVANFSRDLKLFYVLAKDLF